MCLCGLLFGGAALLEAKFYMIGFEHMLEVMRSQDEVEYMPCEVGIVEWSMGGGISREFHRVIYPGMVQHRYDVSNGNGVVVISVVTKALDAVTEAKTEAVYLKTEAEAS